MILDGFHYDTQMFHIEVLIYGYRSKNAHIECKKSKINYNLTECPTEEQITEIERKMNELIELDLPVIYKFVTRDNIPTGVKLDKLPEDASETLRLVRIGDYDICPCMGKYVESTKEIVHSRLQVQTVMKARTALCLR